VTPEEASMRAERVRAFRQSLEPNKGTMSGPVEDARPAYATRLAPFPVVPGTTFETMMAPERPAD
jgi:hypothetical protein